MAGGYKGKGSHRRLIAAVLSLFLWFLLQSPLSAASGYRLKGWKSEDGLPQNTVQALLQSRDGYIWIATRFGLARFDGVQFRTYSLKTHPEMVNDNCIQLAEAPDGSLWIGTERGLLRLNNGEFQRFIRDNGLPEDRIHSLHVTRKGEVWAGFSSGIAILEASKRFAFLRVTPGEDVSALAEDLSGNLLLGTTSGLHVLKLPSREMEKIPITGRQTGTILVSKSGEIWAGGDAGLVRWNGTETKVYDLKNGLASNFVVGLAEEPNYGIWVACLSHASVPGKDSLQVLRPDGTIETIQESAGMAVATMVFDREGNGWLGSTYDGVIRLQRRAFLNITPADGLAGEFIWSLCQSMDGAIWAGTHRGLSRIEGTQIQNFRSADVSALGRDSNNAIHSVWPCRDGGVLAAGDTGLAKYVGGAFLDLRPPNLGGVGHYSCVFEDREGTIWFGTRHSLGMIENGQRFEFATKDGLPDASVRAIMQDSRGTLWIGTYGGGLVRREGSTFKVYTTADGLPNNRVWALHLDANDSLWAGTEDGLCLYKNGRFFSFTTRHGLFDNLVNHILEDDLGNLWLSCNRGISRMIKKELEAVANGELNRAEAIAYGEAEGMLSSETNGEHAPAGWKSKDGMLWFPTTRGVLRIDPNAVPRNTIPPPVLLEFVAADEKIVQGHDPDLKRALFNLSKSTAGQLVFPAGTGRVLEFHYTATSFSAPERVEFKIKLEGYDQDWRNVGSRRVAYYTSLPPGRYNFRVQAANNHGVWNESGAAFAFIIEPHFYETGLFFALGAAVILAAALLAHHWRLKIVRKIESLQREKALEQERSRIARDMHDDLGSNLTQIALLSEVARQRNSTGPKAGEELQKISERARGLVDNLTELIWMINPQNDSMMHLLSHAREYAANYLSEHGIDYRVDLPDDYAAIPLPSEHRRNIFLILKEILHNIVKHAQASKVEIQFEIQCAKRHESEDISELFIRVRDNGKGFDPGASRKGHGLANMQARARAMAGNLSIESSNDQGTVMEVRVPWSIKRERVEHTTFM